MHLANHDSLTDLANRAAFNRRMSEVLSEAAASGRQFGVICFDLDRFKGINDVFGHTVGDMALRAAAQRLSSVAADNFLARIGGDEFTLLVADGPQPITTERLAERLQEAMREDFEIDGKIIKLGLSIGVAIYPDDGTDENTLLCRADAALYRAKEEGRCAIRFFEPQMDEQRRERRALQHDMRTAIEHNELMLHYQPRAKTSSEIVGFEALARWQHPAHGMISPQTFIPLAEETGSIIQLGEWVLRAACREAASWQRPLSISVNLSPVQFRHSDLPALVHSILFETGISSRRLILEITESVLIDDLDSALKILRQLKSLGVRIAMDDFGTGYSSLSYLHAFPLDQIKIDRSFMARLERSQQSATIVRAVIGLGRALNLPVVAEGVETRKQLDFLQREGCAEVQGFLIGKPHPIECYAQIVGRVAEEQALRRWA